MNKKINKWKAGILLWFSIMLQRINVKAGGIQNTKLFTGTQKLAEDLTSGLMGLALIVGTVFIVYFFIRKQAADETDQKMWDKRIRTAAISAIAVFCVATVLKVAVGYFK